MPVQIEFLAVEPPALACNENDMHLIFIQTIVKRTRSANSKRRKTQRKQKQTNRARNSAIPKPQHQRQNTNTTTAKQHSSTSLWF